MEEQREHEVYTLEEAQKDEQLTTQLKDLTHYHREHCPAYAVCWKLSDLMSPI